MEASITVEAGREHDTSRVAQHRHVAGGAREGAHLSGNAQPLVGPDSSHGGWHNSHILGLATGVPGF